MTPPALPQTAQISSIEPSHVAKGTAYVTASRYMWDDFHPYVYETTDYGAHWSAITAGLPGDQYAFVVRQDPNDANLLFLGTKNTVYVSLRRRRALAAARTQPAEGASARSGDRYASRLRRCGDPRPRILGARQPRAAGAISETGLAQTSLAPQAFAPQTAWLTHAYGAPPFPNSAAGENPPFGATVFFNIPASYNGSTPVTLTFSDASGNVVRAFALHLKTKPQPTPAAPLFASAARKRQADFAATGITAGANRFQWDLRYPDATEVTGFNPPIAAGGEEDDVNGPVVIPGNVHGDARLRRQPGAQSHSMLHSIRAFTSIRARSQLDSRSNNAFTRRSTRSIARSTRRWRSAAA